MNDYAPQQTNALLELNPYERAIQEYFAAPAKEKKTACEKLISVLGSHPRLVEEGKKLVEKQDPRIKQQDLPYLSPYLPAQPDRSRVIRDYLRQHNITNAVHRRVLLQRAEETGEIRERMNREYIERLQYKCSLLLAVAMRFLDIDTTKGGGEYDQDFDGVSFRG